MEKLKLKVDNCQGIAGEWLSWYSNLEIFAYTMHHAASLLEGTQ